MTVHQMTIMTMYKMCEIEITGVTIYHDGVLGDRIFHFKNPVTKETFNIAKSRIDDPKFFNLIADMENDVQRIEDHKVKMQLERNAKARAKAKIPKSKRKEKTPQEYHSLGGVVVPDVTKGGSITITTNTKYQIGMQGPRKPIDIKFKDEQGGVIETRVQHEDFVNIMKLMEEDEEPTTHEVHTVDVCKDTGLYYSYEIEHFPEFTETEELYTFPQVLWLWIKRGLTLITDLIR